MSRFEDFSQAAAGRSPRLDLTELFKHGVRFLQCPLWLPLSLGWISPPCSAPARHLIGLPKLTVLALQRL